MLGPLSLYSSAPFLRSTLVRPCALGCGVFRGFAFGVVPCGGMAVHSRRVHAESLSTTRNGKVPAARVQFKGHGGPELALQINCDADDSVTCVRTRSDGQEICSR